MTPTRPHRSAVAEANGRSYTATKGALSSGRCATFRPFGLGNRRVGSRIGKIVRRSNRIGWASVLLLVAPTTAAGGSSFPLSFGFDDPVEDHLQLVPVRQLNPPAGVVDVTGMFFGFDAMTGDYEITLTASADDPFRGPFRINVNLFNPDTGSTAQDPAFFQDLLNDFNLTAPSTSIVLTGSNPRLKAWEAGDRVAPCQGTSFVEFGPCLGGLGLPDGVSGFASGVTTFTGPPPFPGVPAKGSDFLFTSPASTIAVTAWTMPIPGLVVFGLVLMLGGAYLLSTAKKAGAAPRGQTARHRRGR